MINLLLLPFRLLFFLLLLPFRLLFTLSFGIIMIIGSVFSIVGVILALTVVGIVPGALLGLLGLALIAAARRR